MEIIGSRETKWNVIKHTVEKFQNTHFELRCLIDSSNDYEDHRIDVCIISSPRNTIVKVGEEQIMTTNLRDIYSILNQTPTPADISLLDCDWFLISQGQHLVVQS